MDSLIWIGAIVAGGALLLVILWRLRSTREDALLMSKVAGLRAEIGRHGIRATARVVSIRHMEATQGGNAGFDWTLEVELPDGDKYQVSEDQLACEQCFYIDLSYAPYAQSEGAVIPLRIHPRHRELVEIDEAELVKLATQR